MTELADVAAPPEPKIEALLNAAVAVAVQASEGLKVSKSSLEKLGYDARLAVFAQAEAGMWREWGVQDSRALSELGCRFEVRNTLVGVGGWIAPVWDFSRTSLRFLATAVSPPPVRA